MLKLVVFKYSFLDATSASPGAKLQNMKLVGPGSRKRECERSPGLEVIMS